jgi:hypothetical protein
MIFLQIQEMQERSLMFPTPSNNKFILPAVLCIKASAAFEINITAFCCVILPMNENKCIEKWAKQIIILKF